jgi:hypothetical protein
MIKDIISNLLGIDKIKAEIVEATQTLEDAKKQAAEATRIASEAKEQETLAKMSPKERATKLGEPWVAVLDTKVDNTNPRNGFFELDWNKPFVDMLITNGYGFESDPDEEIVDRWFRDLAINILSDEGLDTNRGAGFINVNKITENQSEVH